MLSLGEPDFLSTWSARLLSYIHQPVYEFDIGKSLPYSDYQSSEARPRFDLYATRGSFSGWHVDVYNSTWIRCVDGTKAWYMVPRPSEHEPKDFAVHGLYWKPAIGRVPLIILEPGDLQLMPAGCLIPHALLTITPCLIDGGVYWDLLLLPEILKNVLWIAEHPDPTNESLPVQLPEIFRRLRVLTQRQH